jgi:hypothetical protein
MALVLLSTSVLASDQELHNFPAVFVGATVDDSETEFSYGLEYEYKVNSSWGVGATYEHTEEAEEGAGIDIYVASAYYHPWKSLRIGAGFGKEKIGGHHAETEDLARITLGYDFHVAHLDIAPVIATDFVHGHASNVIGLSIGMPF